MNPKPGDVVMPDKTVIAECFEEMSIAVRALAEKHPLKTHEVAFGGALAVVVFMQVLEVPEVEVRKLFEETMVFSGNLSKVIEKVTETVMKAASVGQA